MKKLDTKAFAKEMLLKEYNEDKKKSFNEKRLKKSKIIDKPKIKEHKEIKVTSNPQSKNHIEEYFSNKEENKDVLTSKELFKAEKKDVDVRTELDVKEIVLVNKLIFNNITLRKYKLFPIFEDFVTEYMRLKISLKRQSRGEFVAMNRGDKSQELIKGMADFSNIVSAKK